MAYLQLRGIEKAFGEARVIKGVNLEIQQGEFIVFVGPSGCGKSTLLRLIAGLETTTAGTIHLEGRDITDEPSSKRDLAMVFQSYALYPHMSVYENMSFALKLAKADPAVIEEKVSKAAEILNLTQYLKRTPKELSGGQRQRVAIGRAIVRSPKVFLFDEPLSNLDAALRGQTRVEIAKLHRDLGATTIYVTHDQVEAMTLADRVVVLRDGLVEQVGTPLELYDRPANQFVAQFIGTPKMNMVGASKLKSLAATGRKFPIDGFVGLRPEYVELVAPADGEFKATVDLVEALGAETLVYVTTEWGEQIVSRHTERSSLVAGEKVGVKIDLSKMAKGSQTIIITSENMRLPKGVTLLDTSPQQLKLTLAAVVEKNVPITPQIIGKLPGNLKIKKITVSPETVHVTIPVTKEEKITEEVLTTPIYLESISTDSKLFCKVIARPSIQPVAKRWPDVEVFIELK